MSFYLEPGTDAHAREYSMGAKAIGYHFSLLP